MNTEWRICDGADATVTLFHSVVRTGYVGTDSISHHAYVSFDPTDGHVGSAVDVECAALEMEELRVR